MKQLLVSLLLLFLIVINSRSQDYPAFQKEFHLVYVELSNNNNRMGITYKLRTLYDELLFKKDDFATFLSNSDRGQFYISDEYINDLFLQIRDMNISLPNAEFDLRKIVEYWNNNDIVSQDSADITSLDYKNLVIHYFISPSFYDLSSDQISFKLLNVMNLNESNHNAGQVQLKFYFNRDDVDNFFEQAISDRENRWDQNPYGYKYETY